MIPAPPPRFAADLPAGTRLVAGLGHATVLAEMDWETFSAAGYHWDAEACNWRGPEGAAKGKKGLEVVGLDNYARHPSTEALLLAYDLKDGLGWRHWHQGLPPPFDLFQHFAEGKLMEAHNSGFERRIWEHVAVKKMGWPEVNPRQWRCSAAKCRAFALPGSLAKAGAVLRVEVQKDARGDSLIKKFCMPRKPTKADPRTRILLTWRPDGADVLEWYRAQGWQPTLKQLAQDYEDTLAFSQYNTTDIRSEAEVSARCPDLEGEELEWWLVDQEVNSRGIHVDRKGLEDCKEIILQTLARYNTELLQITGIEAASQTAKLTLWLGARGCPLSSLDEEAVDAALERTDLLPEVRRVLEIRQAAASASVKKVFAMLNLAADDDRIRDLYVYHGAHTGRATAQGAQPANLPSAGPEHHVCPKCSSRFAGRFSCPGCGEYVLPPGAEPKEWSPEAVEFALELIATRKLDVVEMFFGKGSALKVVAGCLRGLFAAAPGHDHISSDYNSIEAVGLAFLAGEQWRMDVFNTHGKIYEASAAATWGIPFEEFMLHRGYTREQLAQPEWWNQKPANKGAHHPLRKKGKVLELALGYAAWINGARAFGFPGTDDEVKADILRWRAASPAVEWLWGGQTRGKAMGIMQNAKMTAGHVDRWDKTPYYFGIEGCMVQALLTPGVEVSVVRLNGTPTGITYLYQGTTLYCKLPSGRILHYHFAQLGFNSRGERSISFWGWNTNPANGPFGWIQKETFGGRSTENVVQAVCRDILRPACIRLEQNGYPVVMHTYDEIVSEVPHGFGSNAHFEQLVEERPDFARDWPIRAPDSWRGRRYRKA